MLMLLLKILLKNKFIKIMLEANLVLATISGFKSLYCATFWCFFLNHELDQIVQVCRSGCINVEIWQCIMTRTEFLYIAKSDGRGGGGKGGAWKQILTKSI